MHKLVSNPRESRGYRPHSTGLNSAHSSEVSLRDKFTDFYSGLNQGNTKIVRVVENMVREQRDEIHLLTGRIESLNRQIDRQKEYYCKREIILKEMYEEELSIVEHAYQTGSDDSAAPLYQSSGRETNPDNVVSVQERSEALDATTNTESVASGLSDASTQVDTILHRTPSPLTQRARSLHDLGLAEVHASATKAVQSDSVLVLSPKVTSDTGLMASYDYLTCDAGAGDRREQSNISRQRQTGARQRETGSRQRDTEVLPDEDEAMLESERLHQKTQYLYGKLNSILTQFHDNTTQIVLSKDRHKMRVNQREDVNKPTRTFTSHSAKSAATGVRIKSNIAQRSGENVVDKENRLKYPVAVIAVNDSKGLCHKTYSHVESHGGLRRNLIKAAVPHHGDIKVPIHQHLSDRTVNSEISTLATITPDARNRQSSF